MLCPSRIIIKKNKLSIEKHAYNLQCIDDKDGLRCVTNIGRQILIPLSKRSASGKLFFCLFEVIFNGGTAQGQNSGSLHNRDTRASAVRRPVDDSGNSYIIFLLLHVYDCGLMESQWLPAALRSLHQSPWTVALFNLQPPTEALLRSLPDKSSCTVK